MNKIIKELKENLPRECCSFCTHLTLEGSIDDSKYDIKCVLFNSLPKVDRSCTYFEPEYSSLKSDDLDNLYTDLSTVTLLLLYLSARAARHFFITSTFSVVASRSIL